MKQYKDFSKEEKLRHRDRIWKAKLVRDYGITFEEYYTMLGKQHGVCGICGEKPQNEKLCVDHNHDTGKVRGLLCRKCNLALQVVENTLFLQKAISYLGK